MSTPNTFINDLRAGLRVSVISVVWTALSSTVAVVAGLVDVSLVLIAFRLTSLLDAVGSFVLALHFRNALGQSAVSVRSERVALRVVSIGLMVVGVSTAVESVRRLVAGQAGHGSAAGAWVTELHNADDGGGASDEQSCCGKCSLDSLAQLR